jgi:hypothetical protein
MVPAGNWSLAGLSGGQITVSKSNITIQGAGSGNVFDRYGHPTYAASLSGTYTRLFTNNDSKRFVIQGGASNVTIRDIFFDAATSTGGAYTAFLLVINAGKGTTFRNIRLTQTSANRESSFSTFNTPGTSAYDSIFIGKYVANAFQHNSSGPAIVKNCYFYNAEPNLIYESDDVFEGNWIVLDTRTGASDLGPGVGLAASGLHGGNYNFTVKNNYIDGTHAVTFAGAQGVTIGGGVNDPTFTGTINNFVVTGNWLVGGALAGIASCGWAMYGSPARIPGGASGATIHGFTIRNNTLIATRHAQLDFRGTPTGDSAKGAGDSREAYHVTRVVAQNNYLSSPDNQVLSDSYTDRASTSNNVGLDVGAETDTTPPVVSTFTLGPPAGNIVPVTMLGIATYGAVMYLVNESGAPPTSDSKSWTYLPPVSWVRSGGAVTRLYGWTKSTGGLISTRASASVP